MKVSDLALEVAELEGKKKEVSIAQIKEILKCVNTFTNGEFYKWVRKQ
jgi:hypothetical protein